MVGFNFENSAQFLIGEGYWVFIIKKGGGVRFGNYTELCIMETGCGWQQTVKTVGFGPYDPHCKRLHVSSVAPRLSDLRPMDPHKVRERKLKGASGKEKSAASCPLSTRR